jgi:hypothetical protein
LRSYAALLAIPLPQEHVLAEPDFEVFHADLIDNGRVKRIDLLKEATKAGCIGESESAVPRWTNWPIPR